MNVALINPRWRFDGSIYFGCREEHLPLELGYARALMERAGHRVLMLDGWLSDMEDAAMAEAVADFGADMTVVTTAPTYLFWRCTQPELTVPRGFLDALDGRGGTTVAVGPHPSVTPAATLHKLGADIAVRGECEEPVAMLADGLDPRRLPAVATLDDDGDLRIGEARHAGRFVDLPALAWPDAWITRHRHHHHRFDAEPASPGAEVEASRGCPYACTFCAKIDFRDGYRKRDKALLFEEIDRLIAQGVGYVYLIDEILLPDTALLDGLAERPVEFGIQTRIDLWKPAMIELLGRAGCVSVEAGVESLTVEGRAELNKRCRMETDELTRLLVEARRHIPFVQANLIGTSWDRPEVVAEWRDAVRAEGVWANDPVPMYPYPSSPDYRRLFGEPDDNAWERAHEHYLAEVERFSEIQDARPLPLADLETACAAE